MEMRRRALLERPSSNGRTAAQSEIGHGLAALVLDNGVVFGGGKEGAGRIAPGSAPVCRRRGARRQGTRAALNAAWNSAIAARESDSRTAAKRHRKLGGKNCSRFAIAPQAPANGPSPETGRAIPTAAAA